MIAAETQICQASDLLRQLSNSEEQRLLQPSRLMKAQSSISTHLTPAKVHVLTSLARGSSEVDRRGLEIVTKARETLKSLQVAQGLQEAMLASSASAQGAAEALKSCRQACATAGISLADSVDLEILKRELRSAWIADDEDKIMACLMKSSDEATSMNVFKHLLTVGFKEAHVDGKMEKWLAKLNVVNSSMHLSECDRKLVAALCRLAASLEQPVDEQSTYDADLAMLSDQACPIASILALPEVGKPSVYGICCLLFREP